MLTVANTIQEATSASGTPNATLRAGGTDYMDRRRHGLVDGDIVDLFGVPGLDQIETDGGKTVIGALTTIFNIAWTSHIQNNYPGLAMAAGELATPQIRMVGTIGGNLTQRTRCQYYRHNHLQCTKKGDSTCGGRDGYHPNGIIFDNGGCAHPHPSTLGMALMAYDAEIEINGGETRPISALYGDGTDRSKDHLLNDGEMITRILLPAPVAGEKATYLRVSQRAQAEWATVETVVRLGIAGNTISSAAVAVGAVAPVPLRLSQVEAALVGKEVSEETFAAAAALAAEGAQPLRDTQYKVTILANAIDEALRQAAGIE